MSSHGGTGSSGGMGAGAASAAAAGKSQNSTAKRAPSQVRKKPPSENGSSGGLRKTTSNGRSNKGERTVKKLRLTKALTIPDGTTVADACRRMATRRVDAALLTDTSALLCGIITDKDVATRVIAEGLNPDETSVSRVMTRNPIFVTSDTLAVDALQKMVQGKFRHLPVVENGEVVALLDITKCLYDAIARMEKAAEKGNAIAAAVEDVERQWGNNLVAPSTFIETLRERMFRPTLGSLITELSKVATVSPADSVYAATKKMRDLRVNSVVITTASKPQGILTSKDVLMRVVAMGLSPETTAVEKVMTANPECASANTTIVDALHIMHDGKFLHLPVVDKDGYVVACVDVLQLTHGAVATVGSNGASGAGDMASTMMQKFWDSALALEPPEDEDDTHSDISGRHPSEALGSEIGKMVYPSLGLGNSFAFKLEDQKGRIHRFTCGTESLTELISAIVQRVGNDIDRTQLPHIMYEDDEGDRVLLSNDSDLVAAINFARASSLKGLKLYLDFSHLVSKERISPASSKTVNAETWSSTHTAVAACAVAILGVGILLYLRRSTTDIPSRYR
ncbi:hypothetical protein O6H91_07G114300 [Diphasiastrum complanatum]|uniref:Uncharacterized protein n=1 Tax=Diphasiastrum complanatum TaxID=34168 RepID=A0ACC2D9A3_DIPCM|nr:hypothetical protein O6H91_07G114300 [Diphasiastrum complanatum]